ncbi:MAG: hypothetical protein M1824_003099 [Vezdaea acicularis]|nr:MAG: hypothetical protein M1824_003099 [Vezdaea acicularis]
MSTSKSPATTKQKRAPASRSSHGIETATGPPPALSTQRSHSNDVVLVRRAHHPADFAFAHQHLSTGARSNSVSSSNTSDTSSQHRARDEDDARSASASVSTSNSSSLVHRRNRNRDSQETARPSRRRSLRPDDDNMHSRGPSRYGEDLLDHDRDRTLRALEGLHDDNIDNNQPDREEYSSSIGDRSDGERAQGANDDLFLNLARASSSRQGNEEASARNERRRSRIALASHRQSLPLNSYSSPLTRSALKDAELNNQDSSPAMAPNSAEAWQPQHGRRTSHGMSPTIQHRPAVREKSYAASAHPLEDSGRRRYSGMGARSSFSTPRGAARETSPESTVSHERRSSIKMPARLNGYRPSNLSYSAPRNYHSSPLIDRSPAPFDDQAVQEAPHKDGTESTASTTAPSTVWDELDDLKSRIRKLELTGKLPPSSGADISQASGDRPRTATTTVTTISSSPKHGRQNSISPSSSTLGGPGAANLHPLLHSALAKTKPLISQDIYRALEATASDALSIAALSNSGNGSLSASQSVINGPTSPSVPDRHLRRKADSMCRGLTELCIALSEAPSKTSAGSPTATPQASTVGPEPPIPNGIYNDAPYTTTAPSTVPSQIPRSSPSALNRLEARRSSMLALQSTPSPRTSSQTPTNASNTPPTYAPSSTPSHRLPRSSTLLSRRYGSRTYTPNPTAATAAIDNDRDDVESTRSFRAPSRAATDVGYIRHSPREGRISREYTSSHPLPQMESPAAAAAALAATSSSSTTTTPSTALTLTNGTTGLGRSPSVQSTSNHSNKMTPLRRHYGSASLSNMPSPASPGGVSLNGGTGLNSRRFLDRNSAPPPSNTNTSANTPTQIIDRDTLTTGTKSVEREARTDLAQEGGGPVASFMDGLRRSRAGSLGRSGSRKLRQAVVDPLPPPSSQQKR